MDFDLSDDQRQIKDSVDRFLAEVIETLREQPEGIVDSDEFSRAGEVDRRKLRTFAGLAEAPCFCSQLTKLGTAVPHPPLGCLASLAAAS